MQFGVARALRIHFEDLFSRESLLVPGAGMRFLAVFALFEDDEAGMPSAFCSAASSGRDGVSWSRRWTRMGC